MKILHVISSCNPKIGGPIQGIRNYQEEINKRNIKRDVVCFESPADVLTWNFPKSLNVIALGRPKGLWQYNKQLVPWLNTNYSNYDIIIINGLWIYNSFGVVNFLKRIKSQKSNKKIPKVYIMCHGMLDPWFQKSKTRIFKAIRNFFYWHVIEKNVVNSVDGLLFTTEQELLLARKSFIGYKPKKELNIGYGIEEPPSKNLISNDQFYNEFNIDKNDSYLLYLSRIDSKKGLDLILVAYKHLLYTNEYAKKLPCLIIAGPGIDSSYGKSQAKFIKDNPILLSKVKFLGHLIGDNKWAAIHNCEAFILPSHTENFGIAVAEALGCSKPVLISNKVNIYKEIENGLGGFISNDDLNGTINNLVKWMNLSDDEKFIMAKNAYSIYKQNFTSKEAVERFVNILCEN